MLHLPTYRGKFGIPATSTNLKHVPYFSLVEVAGTTKAEDLISSEEKRKRTVFNTAKEIMTSEETFVGVLKLLNCDFREAIKEAGGTKIISEEDERRIFSNLMEMQILNGDLLKDFRESIENWEERPQIAEAAVASTALVAVRSISCL